MPQPPAGDNGQKERTNDAGNGDGDGDDAVLNSKASILLELLKVFEISSRPF